VRRSALRRHARRSTAEAAGIPRLAARLDWVISECGARGISLKEERLVAEFVKLGLSTEGASLVAAAVARRLAGAGAGAEHDC
jgi:hypothetical protein